MYLHINNPTKFPSLDDAVDPVREKRGLHPDELYSAPKPTLIEAARVAARQIHLLKAS
ncbi:MAG: hypothetical protein ACJA0Z_002361 [Halioglobus sp.]